jgi:hypothetical protein
MNKIELEKYIVRLVWLYANTDALQEQSINIHSTSKFYDITNITDNDTSGGN